MILLIVNCFLRVAKAPGLQTFLRCCAALESDCRNNIVELRIYCLSNTLAPTSFVYKLFIPSLFVHSYNFATLLCSGSMVTYYSRSPASSSVIGAGRVYWEQN